MSQLLENNKDILIKQLTLPSPLPLLTSLHFYEILYNISTLLALSATVKVWFNNDYHELG